MDSMIRKGLIIFAILITFAVIELAIALNKKEYLSNEEKVKIALNLFEEKLKNDSEIADYVIKKCDYKNEYGDNYICYVKYDVQTISETTSWSTVIGDYGTNNWTYDNYLYLTISCKNGNYFLQKTSASQY